MARLIIRRETKKPKASENPLRLGRLRKYDDYSFQRFLKRLNFFGLPYGVYVEGGWVPDENGKAQLYIHTRIGCKDVYDRRRSLHIGRAHDKWVDLPRGRSVSERWLLNYIRNLVIDSLAHEVDESFHVDGHKVFNPHTKTGRRRILR